MKITPIRGLRTGIAFYPFSEPDTQNLKRSEIMPACLRVEVYQNPGDRESEMIFDALNKAASRFKLAPPLSSWCMDQFWLTCLFFPYSTRDGGREITIKDLALEMADASVPGSHWYLARLLERIDDPEVSVEVINRCKFPPKETLVLLSSCETFRGAKWHYAVGRVNELADIDAALAELRKVPLRRPAFDDMDMLASLSSLPGQVVMNFSDAVYEALALWDFGRTAGYIIDQATKYDVSLPVLRTFAILSEAHADTSEGVRAVHGLLSKPKADFSKMKFTPEFSKYVVSTAKLLHIHCLAELGTPLNNEQFARWIQSNKDLIRTLSSTFKPSSPNDKPPFDAYTQDGLILHVMERLINGDRQALDVIADRLHGRREDREVARCAQAMAVLLGSAGLSPKDRGLMLDCLFRDNSILEKFSCVSKGLRQSHRVVEVGGDSPLLYSRAPVRAANLALWLASHGIALTFTDSLENLKNNLPRIVKLRLLETNTLRKLGYGIWLSWITGTKWE